MHDPQTQFPGLNIGGRETAAVVADAQLGSARGQVPERDCGSTGAGMLDDVVERLLRNTVEGHMGIAREHARAFHIHLHRNAFPAGGGFGQLAQQIAELGLGEGSRAELEKQRAHFGQRAAAELAQLAQQGQAFVVVALPHCGESLGDQAGREESLGDGIVKLTGDPLPLLQHRRLLRLLVQRAFSMAAAI